jgi:hypothetical protein
MKTTEKPSEALEGGIDGRNRLEQGKGRDTDLQIPLLGVQTPRIHTPLNDLPSRGGELIDLAASLGVELMEWQKFALIHTHKYKADGRWASPVNCIVVARQNGKSFLQQIRILGGLFLWDEPLQIGQAHTLNTSLEQFRQMMWTIEANASWSKRYALIMGQRKSRQLKARGLWCVLVAQLRVVSADRPQSTWTNCCV